MGGATLLAQAMGPFGCNGETAAILRDHDFEKHMGGMGWLQGWGCIGFGVGLVFSLISGWFSRDVYV